MKVYWNLLIHLYVGDGRVYSWGRGTFGRLGLGSEADQLFPARLDFFESVTDGGTVGDNRLKIVGIAAGAYHSLALAGFCSVLTCDYDCYYD